MQNGHEVLVLGEDDGFGAGIMLAQPYYVTSESVNLGTIRILKVDVFDLIQNP